MGILHDRADVTATELLKQRVNPETGMLENDEARMTNDEKSPINKVRRKAGSHIIRASSFLRTLLIGLDRKSTTSELQSPYDLVCRLLLEKKKKNNVMITIKR